MLFLKAILAFVIGLSIFSGIGILTTYWHWTTFIVPLIISFLAGVIYEVISAAIIEWSNNREPQPDQTYRG